MLATTGIVLVVAGQAVCERVLQPVVNFIVTGPERSCPASRPAELWWLSLLAETAAATLWFIPQRGTQRWPRPFLPLTVRRRLGAAAGATLMMVGASLLLVVVVGRLDEALQLIGWSLTTANGTALVVAASIAITWWGAAELAAAAGGLRSPVIDVLGVAGIIGVVVAVIVDLLRLGYPGIGMYQLAAAYVLLVPAVVFALTATPKEKWVVPSRRTALVAGITSILLATWLVAHTVHTRPCLGLIGCGPDALASQRVLMPVTAATIYLLVARYRRHEEIRAAYQDESQFAPISTA